MNSRAAVGFPVVSTPFLTCLKTQPMLLSCFGSLHAKDVVGFLFLLILDSTPWAMPPGICHPLMVGAPTGLPSSASTLWAGTGALASLPFIDTLAFTDGTLDLATKLSVSLSSGMRSRTPWAIKPPGVCSTQLLGALTGLPYSASTL